MQFSAEFASMASRVISADDLRNGMKTI